MKLIHRFGYFGVGLFFGIVLLIFFLGGKNASCDYSPNARVLKNIKIKERKWSEESLSFFQDRKIDTSYISEVLEKGDVDFNLSDTDAKPCNIYYVTGTRETKELEFRIQNCDSIATIQKIKIRTAE